VPTGLQMLRPVVGSIRSLGELTQFPVLGAVTTAFPSRKQHMFRRHLWRYSAATAGLCVVLVVVLALNWSGFRLHLTALGALVKS
jgi:hypothetical protein